MENCSGFHGGKPMTVCIAAACEGGRKVVVSTDGLLSYGSVTSDTMLAKITWFNDWCCLYAGQPSNVSMIFGEFESLCAGQKITRSNIQKLMLRAYQKRMAGWLSSRVLSPYDLSLEEFKKEGRTIFGPAEFSRLSRAINEDSQYFNDQLIVIGWGKTEASCMIYQVSRDGDSDHALEGIAAIGTGHDIALSTLMLLGQSRDCSLGETLYSVAAAKFSAEKSHGQDVGESTSMYITWQRTEKDKMDKPVGVFVQRQEKDQLRQLWENHGRPRIPDEAWLPLQSILQSLELPFTITGRSAAYLQRRYAKALKEKEVAADSAAAQSHREP
jgi:ATP-dependent protease HslVU (ClpYQ) peptidase subunit